MNFKTFSQREAEKSGKITQPVTGRFSPHLRQQIVDIFHNTIELYYANEHIGIGNDAVATNDFWNLYERLVRREIAQFLRYLSHMLKNYRYVNLNDPRIRICRFI